MAITGLPTFADKEVPTHTKLNLFNTVLANKFANGITGADLKYPFQLAGNLDLNGYTILNFGNGIANVRFASAFPSIQDAINDLGEGGGLVFVPAGTFTLPATLELASSTANSYTSVALVGSGYSTVLKAATGFATGTPVVRLAKSGFTSGNMQLTNLQIDCNSQSGVTGVAAGGTSNSTLANVFITNCVATNISASSASYFTLDAVNCTGGVTGVSIAQASGVNGPYFFSNCTFRNQTGSCISASWYGNLTITDSFMTPSGGNTFQITHDTAALANQLMILNTINDGGAGGIITCIPPCSNIIVSNNVFANSSAAGLRFNLQGSNLTRGIDVIGNLFTLCSDSGLDMSGGPATAVAVSGNTFYQTVTAGGDYQLLINSGNANNKIDLGTIVGNTFQKGSGGNAIAPISLGGLVGASRFVLTGNVADQTQPTGLGTVIDTTAYPTGAGHLLGVNIFG